ncbi:MAG: hypothetical protein ACRDZM_04680 [Acidimicrobiia bacterium]
MTDELRERLGRLDPMPSEVPTESVTSQSSRDLLEKIMSTTPVEQPDTRSTPKKNGWLLGVAAAAALVVAVGGAIALTGGSEDPLASGPPLVLDAGVDDPMAMCIVFSVEELAKMPVAFEGTVTSAEGETVTLDVDQWFKGGDAGQVQINAPAGMEALLGGIPFEVGSQYLVTAYDGTVSYCGFTGPSTPELRAAFEEAFAG